jgi:hypothetical protein
VAAAGGARGEAEESSGNSTSETSARSWGLRKQQRSSLSAEEKIVGLKGDGGSEVGVGGG